MLPELAGWDWKEVFHYAGDTSEETSGQGGSPERALPNDLDLSVAPVFREDVVRILAIDEGEHDEMDWLVVGELKDGRYFAISAGCDYTGWG